jgi:hypothetical protein
VGIKLHTSALIRAIFPLYFQYRLTLRRRGVYRINPNCESTVGTYSNVVLRQLQNSLVIRTITLLHNKKAENVTKFIDLRSSSPHSVAYPPSDWYRFHSSRTPQSREQAA